MGDGGLEMCVDEQTASLIRFQPHRLQIELFGRAFSADCIHERGGLNRFAVLQAHADVVIGRFRDAKHFLLVVQRDTDLLHLLLKGRR